MFVRIRPRRHPSICCRSGISSACALRAQVFTPPPILLHLLRDGYETHVHIQSPALHIGRSSGIRTQVSVPSVLNHCITVPTYLMLYFRSMAWFEWDEATPNPTSANTASASRTPCWSSPIPSPWLNRTVSSAVNFAGKPWASQEALLCYW